jgi:hypothetical protein
MSYRGWQEVGVSGGNLTAILRQVTCNTTRLKLMEGEKGRRYRAERAAYDVDRSVCHYSFNSGSQER